MNTEQNVGRHPRADDHEAGIEAAMEAVLDARGKYVPADASIARAAVDAYLSRVSTPSPGPVSSGWATRSGDPNDEGESLGRSAPPPDSGTEPAPLGTAERDAQHDIARLRAECYDPLSGTEPDTAKLADAVALLQEVRPIIGSDELHGRVEAFLAEFPGAPKDDKKPEDR